MQYILTGGGFDRGGTPVAGQWSCPATGSRSGNLPPDTMDGSFFCAGPNGIAGTMSCMRMGSDAERTGNAT